MITGNKGEWSEIYTLFKILGDKKLYAGDSGLNKIENLIFPIIKILRDESQGTFQFNYQNDLVIIKNNKKNFQIPINTFKAQARFLLNILQKKTDRTFSVPEVEEFMMSFQSKTLKAKSTVKSDITIVIHDQRSGVNPELGFSIKSQLGGASTLLNAGKTTNFVFEITDRAFSPEEMKNINNISGRSKIQKRLKKIIELGGNLKFTGNESVIFDGNLILIDSGLPVILAHCLKLFFTSHLSKITDLIEETARVNPLKFNTENKHPFYSYKIKRLLTDIALGMMPSQVWTGKLDATGGYLIVKKDGEVVCYHIYNRNEFENYLFNNTKLETASSGRHDFGYIYEEDGKQFFKLNLQIRFL